MILRKRAEEILSLVQKAQDEISLSDETIAGDISIGAGESDGVRYLARAAKEVQTEYPLVHFHIVSGDKVSVLEELDRGLLDFALVFNEIDVSKYEAIELPCSDRNGVLMRRDDPLAVKDSIAPKDLWDKPLIVSRQALKEGRFLDRAPEQLNIAATYNLLFNGSIMVQEGMGYAIGFDKIINVSGDSSLCYRPLTHSASLQMYLIWKKYQVLTKAAEIFLQKITHILSR